MIKMAAAIGMINTTEMTETTEMTAVAVAQAVGRICLVGPEFVWAARPGFSFGMTVAPCI